MRREALFGRGGALVQAVGVRRTILAGASPAALALVCALASSAPALAQSAAPGQGGAGGSNSNYPGLQGGAAGQNGQSYSSYGSGCSGGSAGNAGSNILGNIPATNGSAGCGAAYDPEVLAGGGGGGGNFYGYDNFYGPGTVVGTYQGGAGGAGGNGAVAQKSGDFDAAGGGGGGGGTGYIVGAPFSLTIGAATLQGGAGGNGGFGDQDGGGGGGGYGLSNHWNGLTITVSNNGQVLGGQGGAGSYGAQGGTGLYNSGNGVALTNSGLIEGGNGGGGGQNGAGVVSTSNLTIINTGSIVGGGSGSSQGDSIDFTGGSNTLAQGQNSKFGGNVEIGAGAVLTIDQTGDLGSQTNRNADLPEVYGGGSLTINAGSNTVGVSNLSSNVTGATTVSSGTLKGLATDDFSPNSATTVDSGATLDLGGFSQTINSVTLSGGTIQHGSLASSGGIASNGGAVDGIGGATGLTLNSGVTTLTVNTGANTYTGATHVAGGTLKAGAENAFSAASATTVDVGATLDLGGFIGGTDQTVSSLSGGGTVTDSGVTPATLTNAGASSKFSGVIEDGAGKKSKTGLTQNSIGNTLTLTGANTYTGATTITAGTLQIGGAGSLGSGSYAGAISDAGTFEYSSSAAQELSGVISGAGGLTQNGPGTLTLSGANTYQGPTLVAAGTLRGGAANAFSAVSATTVDGGATLDLGGFNETVTSLSGAGSGAAYVTNKGLSSPATLTNQGASSTFSGVIKNGVSATGLAERSAGNTLTLTGVNTYTGATTITAGNLRIGGSGSLGSGSYAGAISDAGTFEYSSSAAQKLSGVISGAGGLTQNRAGDADPDRRQHLHGRYDDRLGLDAADQRRRGLARLLRCRDICISMRAIRDAGTFEYSSGAPQMLSGVISGAGGLTQNGQPGEILTLSGANTYQGATLVAAGTLRGGAENAFSVASATTVDGGAFLDLGGFNETVTSLSSAGSGTAYVANYGSRSATLTNDGGSSTFGGVIENGTSATGITQDSKGNTLKLTGVNTYTGNTRIRSGSTLQIGGAGLLGSGSYAGAISDAGTFEYSSSAAQTLTGVISGAGGLTQNGTGTLTPTAVNTYTGATTIGSGSTLQIGGAGLLGSGSYAGAIRDDGTFEYSSGAAQTLTGAIRGAGGLTQNGTGTLTLTGANTYTGNTTIGSGSTLQIGGAGLLGSGSYAGAIRDDGTFEYSSGAAQTLTGAIRGAGGLTQNGTGC